MFKYVLITKKEEISFYDISFLLIVVTVYKDFKIKIIYET